MTSRRCSAVPVWWLAFVLPLFALTAHAKRHSHPDPTPVPVATPSAEPVLSSEAAPDVSPDAPPSASLQRFLDKHLSQILAPLGTAAFTQREVLVSLKAAYADALKAAPPAHQPAYQAAAAVCDAMSNAITERHNAADALHGALATRSSESVQPRGGLRDAAERSKQSDAFFLGNQKMAWNQRAAFLRENITNLYLRERETERQIGSWAPVAPVPRPASAQPALAAAPAPEVTATPSVSAPSPSPAPAPDPVAGVWNWQDKQTVTVAEDNVAHGEKNGSWKYVSTTSEGRFYEFHWKHKGWVDYVTLSPDNRTLDGKNAQGQHVFAHRE